MPCQGPHLQNSEGLLAGDANQPGQVLQHQLLCAAGVAAQQGGSRGRRLLLDTARLALRGGAVCHPALCQILYLQHGLLQAGRS